MEHPPPLRRGYGPNLDFLHFYTVLSTTQPFLDIKKNIFQWNQYDEYFPKVQKSENFIMTS